MSCFRPKKSRTPPSSSSPKTHEETRKEETPDDSNNNVKHDVLLRIPECRVHLMDGGEAVELAAGDLQVQRISDQNVALATAIKVGRELQWPLLKDEPVVKLDALHYLFTLPMKDGEPLSYGVAFAEKRRSELGLLDAFLKENSLFTTASSPPSGKRKDNIDWKEFAPAVDSYNSVLAKSIVGAGQEITQRSNSKNKGSLNKSLKRARKLSKMTEKLSKSMLNMVEGASSSVVGSVVQSRAGKAFYSMLPGEVLLASLDALNKILDAAEAAERQAMNATSGAVTTAVSNSHHAAVNQSAHHPNQPTTPPSPLTTTPPSPLTTSQSPPGSVLSPSLRPRRRQAHHSPPRRRHHAASCSLLI